MYKRQAYAGRVKAEADAIEAEAKLNAAKADRIKAVAALGTLNPAESKAWPGADIPSGICRKSPSRGLP